MKPLWFFHPSMAVDHYENFPVASLLLPPRFRRPVALIYRFAREADDFADEGDICAGERIARLDAFREQIARIGAGEPPTIAWFEALGEVIREFELPLDAFRDLICAFSQDVTKTRYADFGEVLEYCTRSANPVGRLLLHLYGRPTARNVEHSDAICTSLQLINFLQDIAIDYRKGRIYLPQDELERFGVAETEIAAGKPGAHWRRFIVFQVERARGLLHSGAPLGRALPGRVGLEMRMIIAGGDRILTKIMRVRGDVFRRRPTLRAYDWPLMFLRTIA